MLMTVGTFVDKVEDSLNAIVDELQTLTGRLGEQERVAWRNSLTELSAILATTGIDNVDIILEYRLPLSSSWCDAVLLGRDRNGCLSVVIVELKHWDTSGTQAGPTPGLIRQAGSLRHHPSDQVAGYVHYCQRFHSALHGKQVKVQGCTLLTGKSNASAFREAPHVELAQEFLLFDSNSQDAFREFLSEHIQDGDRGFSKEFSEGTYKQDRDFTRQIAETLRSGNNFPYVLLDEQKKGLEHCLFLIAEVVNDKTSEQKQVIIIEGPPGSGKSVLAACLWAEIVHLYEDEGDIVFTATSSSQKSNWKSLFEGLGPGAKHFIRTANQYSPATVSWISKHNKANSANEIKKEKHWEENIRIWQNSEVKKSAESNFLVSIVDEAHALVDPSHAEFLGNPMGYAPHFGPQAYHIINASRLSVFLLDSEQSFRDIETTGPEEIIKCAEQLGANVAKPISLAGAQYRCGGSKEYIDWLESSLRISKPQVLTTDWRQSQENPDGTFVFELVRDPLELEERIKEKLLEGETGRLVSTYGRKWITKGKSNPHSLPAKDKDFKFNFRRNGQLIKWNRIWNFCPTAEDYTHFIQAPPGSRMHDDPFCEVGCPYVVRGFDYTYLGLLWLRDLVWDGSKWKFNLSNIHETAWKSTLSRVKKSWRDDDPHSLALLNALKSAYRILASRAIKGLFVYVEDDQTREYLQGQLSSPSEMN